MNHTFKQKELISKFIIILLGLFCLSSLYLVEHFKQQKGQPYYKEKINASALAQKSFQEIKQLRNHRKTPINSSLDPQKSGLIGAAVSPITTKTGSLVIKQKTIQPDLAILFIEWFKSMNLKEGDTIAVAMTGSFPALNISMLSAIKTLELKPLLIFSLGSSQYGANLPGLTWATMYRHLQNKKIFNYQPLAISLGGRQDRFYKLSLTGKNILTKTIETNNYPFLEVNGTHDSIKKRILLYKNHAGSDPIKAYLNIGGGMASIGLIPLDQTNTPQKIPSLENGIVKTLHISLVKRNSVAINFLKEGIPVINLHNISNLLKKNTNSHLKSMLIHLEYNKKLAFIILLINTLLLFSIAFLSRKHFISYKQKK
jgi:poly-gamma-glutamate system protein